MTTSPADLSVPELTAVLRDQGYIADRGLATSLLLSLKLGKPLLLEGEVGDVTREQRCRPGGA